MSYSTLCIRSSILNVVCCQCSVRRNDVIYSELRLMVASQSEQFCTYFSLSRTECGKPYRGALQNSNEDETNACKFVCPIIKDACSMFFFQNFFKHAHRKWNDFHDSPVWLYCLLKVLFYGLTARRLRVCLMPWQSHVAINIRFIIQSNRLRTPKGHGKKSAY